MTRFLLGLLLVGCAHAAAPAAKPAPPAQPPPPVEQPVAAKAEKPEIVVFSDYQDFSGHGYNGSGRGYRKGARGWVGADCFVSHVADPEAGPQPGMQCGEWSAEPADHAATLDALPKHGVDITCRDRPDVCASLGLKEQHRNGLP